MIKQTWRKASQKRPTLVPIEQTEAAVNLASHNTAAFTIQMCQEQMLLMLHETYGFGRVRCMRALTEFQARMAQWQMDVQGEFDAETFRMTYKEKQAHRTELDYTWEKHDQALKPLVSKEIWRPYTERYRVFGGSGAWCD